MSLSVCHTSLGRCRGLSCSGILFIYSPRLPCQYASTHNMSASNDCSYMCPNLRRYESMLHTDISNIQMKNSYFHNQQRQVQNVDGIIVPYHRLHHETIIFERPYCRCVTPIMSVKYLSLLLYLDRNVRHCHNTGTRG